MRDEFVRRNDAATTIRTYLHALKRDDIALRRGHTDHVLTWNVGGRAGKKHSDALPMTTLKITDSSEKAIPL